MNIKEVKDLIREILQSDISEFELEHTGTRVRFRRGVESTEESRSTSYRKVAPPLEIPAIQPAASAVAPSPAPPKSIVGVEEDNLHLITSPIVGTFYRSPSPGADPYVKIGDVVEEGSILCVVEAMKLMNEIPSDAAGQIVRIYVENSHPVEFGQKLFGIRLSA